MEILLKTNVERRRGSIVNTPLGEIEFNKKGEAVAEIEDESELSEIINLLKSHRIDIKKKSPKPPKQDGDLDENQDENSKTTNENGDETPGVEELRASLAEKNIQTLRNEARKLDGVEELEWKALKKVELIEFLITKLM